ncbi:MAG: fibronectin type III domain-containing protein [Dysgonamonadaceae bacterium]|jgi:hypothetical protein|nr:fibronectin type III domain-containing protein [Dysgonamonadaceae bacterium]
MKKIILLLVGCIVGLITATAQINSYSFAYTAGTYSEVSGGTVVYSGAAQGAESLRLENYAFVPDDTLINEIATVSGYPIGFNFNLGEQVFTHFAISPNGFIYLGGADPFSVDAAEVSSDINVGYGIGTKKPVLSDDARFEEGATNVLGFSRVTAVWPSGVLNDISATTADANTEISYLLSGTAGSQVLTIQFKKIILSWSADARDAVDIQIRLYEADSKVELIFNDFNTGGDTAWAEIGLKGNVLGNTKYLSLTQNGNWSAVTAGVTGNLSLRNTVCANGTTFTFTPPPTCVAPTSQPTGLQLTATTNSISGNFTATAADKYLVLMAKNISLAPNVKPDNDRTYNVGDSIGSKLRVVAYSSATTFNVDNLEGSAKYNFYIYAVNSECLFGPKYNTTNALQGNIKTLPLAPRLSLAEGGFTSLKLAAGANSANDPVIIAQNIGQWAVDGNSNQLNDGVFGTPTLDLNVGDNIPGGGKIIYKGVASNAIEVTGLPANKLVNFAAWSYNGTDNTISSESVLFNVLTWGETPYALVGGQFARYHIPVDWEEEGGYFRLESDPSTNRGSYLSCNSLPASETGSYASITTQYLKLAPGANRLHLTGRLFQTSNDRPFPENDLTEWNEKDSLQVLVIKYGTTDTVAVHTVKAAAANTFGGNFNVGLPITGFAGDTVKVKLAWRVHSTGKSNSLQITSYVIEEIPEHEAPINLTVDQASIIGNQAKVSWQKHATGTESAWEVHYRPLNAETWSTPVESNDSTYLFTTLPTDTIVEVQVRAIVGLNVYSPWTLPALSFNTGRGLPYYEDFDSYTAQTFGSSSGWTISSTSAILWNSSALRFRVSQTAPATASALLPKFDFEDGSVNYQLAFDLSAVGAVPADDSLYVVVKTEGEDIILKKYSNTVTGRDTIALEGFTGIKQIGFKVIEKTRSTSTSIYFALDNVSIIPTCPVVVSNAQATEVKTTEAKVSWEGDADEWLVFIRKAGETTKNFVVWTENDTVFTGLDEATAYEVGVTTSCTPGDTAKVTIVSFVTLTTIPCDPVSNIEASSTTESVTLAWESEAAKFNVKFRQAGAETWTERNGITETTTTFTGLTHNTNYEYSIQAVCSEAEGDISGWSEVATVKTIEITCFAPTNLTANPIGYNTATLSWTGDAAKYELAWAQTGSEWTVVEVEGASYSLTGLTSETAYQAKVRSICAEGDTSVYSQVYTFTTTQTPPCPIPTNLSVSSISDQSAVLSWTADDANTSWDLRYRSSTSSAWTYITTLEEASYELTGLTANTVYLWRVKAHCAATENESAEASQVQFTTTRTGISSIENVLKVFASNRIINVLNPEGGYIDHIRLYGLDGSLLLDFDVRSSDHVLIPTAIDQTAVIVKVYTQSGSSVFKVVIK